ncbi:sarcosine oxidase subunit delta [Gluconacetobacter azotocaptans]|uniref:Sarcosine oxidase subunit delta n=1 Tax=Gluconacetobacter azotocaptans TaxID=142834 RepID=A0A7W4JTX9_9PROT|nr:sarcosine oxidase subunit delta [Gluconacetobacter azotocaptans]MBB2190819.1 sarcosine oxidase subunit delta [Gluconacetobacter azotocaptans]MBM9400735.1 sarcosine oxidase subunit delta [Gluconacetobacter azotocaptans]GBQ30873.1 sarcosine oxidase delta subunit [Gluconacetobacter azotocaptans DSM 13594]
MRLPCSCCGPRDSGEFVYRGDATLRRPPPDAPETHWADYVYLRDNPAGPHRELWYHQPCRSWLVITRDTRSHAILAAEAAEAVARAVQAGPEAR